MMWQRRRPLWPLWLVVLVVSWLAAIGAADVIAVTTRALLR